MPVTKDIEVGEILKVARDLRLAEQEILGESLRKKSEKIRELEAEIRFLKDLLVHWQSAPRPQAQPSPRHGSVPRRWKVQT
jgi:hypothetical protein